MPNYRAVQESPLLRATAVKSATRSMLGRFAEQFSDSPVSFEVTLPDGSVQPFGPAEASFSLVIKNQRGLTAIASIDEGRIGDAYVAGDIEIEGDMLQPFHLREQMKDLHPVAYAWRFLQPLLFGQLRTNSSAISDHYDIDSDFFLSFLDPAVPCYTQGVYIDSGETLEAATLRKFHYCFERCQLKPGHHILEIGPGWGAWFEYASARGIKCSGLTISRESADYLSRRATELGYDWEIIFSDLLQYETDRKYDAIVIMGVIEHLPQYQLVLEKFASLVKPDGHIFLDGSACTKKYELSSYMVKYIYGGNHSFLVLHEFLGKLAKTPLEVLEIFNDRYSYYLTFLQWARNFESRKGFVIERFGDFHYRRFRLYLWGAAYEFLSRSLDCYRMVIRNTTTGRAG
jgi:cyclopropane-fatty-acyl-phospholipid synthase